MILLDAIYINRSGGKVLLDYLIKSLVTEGLDVFYLLDARVEGQYPELDPGNCLYMESSFFKRYNYYRANKARFEKILCFGNIPPVIKCKAEVYTYFHQLLFLDLPENIRGIAALKVKLKTAVLKFLRHNTDHFIVQSAHVKERFVNKYRFLPDRVIICPFYPELPPIDKDITPEENTFIYVSGGGEHKNHKMLFNAFEAFYLHHKRGTLTVTIPEGETALLQLIEDKQANNIPITNLGFIPREQLSEHYARNAYLIYPSLAESFGLGLIEAIKFGCEVLAADLPYTYQVCEPSYAFDPLDVTEIETAFEAPLKAELPATLPKIENRIQELIAILKP